MFKKIIIPEHTMGFVYKDGRFVRTLPTGSHRLKRKESYKLSKMEGIFILSNAVVSPLETKTLIQHAELKSKLIIFDVPDGHIGIHYLDGHFRTVYQSGVYCFWNVNQDNTFKIISKARPEITDFSESELRILPTSVYHKVTVPQGYTGVLYFDGAFEKMLTQGVYFYWKGDVAVNMDLIDLRQTQIELSGQEILTADKVGLRINFVCTYQIADAFNLIEKINNYHEQLYVTTQLILRTYIGKYRIDELLAQKEEIAGFVLDALKQKEEELYVKFIDAGVKDIILPGEIREIMNTVLIAEKRAQANVITRREEVASTRSLLNTAKLMEDNQTLYKLKELEYLERICERVGNISVGSGDLLEQLAKVMNTR